MIFYVLHKCLKTFHIELCRVKRLEGRASGTPLSTFQFKGFQPRFIYKIKGSLQQGFPHRGFNYQFNTQKTGVAFWIS